MKKAFTLVELIGVIVLLGLLVLISVPSINKVITSGRENIYTEQINRIISAAKSYMSSSKNSLKLPTNKSESYCLTVDTLKKEGKLSNEDIQNPNYKEGNGENKYLDGAIKIVYQNGYTYTYMDSADCTKKHN